MVIFVEGGGYGSEFEEGLDEGGLGEREEGRVGWVGEACESVAWGCWLGGEGDGEVAVVVD